ncbi:hypothetical protein FACS1894110_09720 [Spirochaetia bacterium]|nr:hypothetical protein FACS1894110_09720 [Spirochaetia bacterium]
MSLAFYVVSIIGIAFEAIILTGKFFKWPQKLMDFLTTIEEPVTIIVIAILTYIGVTSA